MTKVTIDRALIEQAVVALEITGNAGSVISWKHEIGLLRKALAEPAVESVKFLANGTRFKMSFFHNEDSEGQVAEGMYVTCFEGFEDELDGRWVALVPAEDDCHMKLKAPPPPPAEPAPVPLLSDEEMWQLWNAQGDDAMDQVSAIAFARDVEQLVRRKAGL